jgi:hypothetical protein
MRFLCKKRLYFFSAYQQTELQRNYRGHLILLTAAWLAASSQSKAAFTAKSRDSCAAQVTDKIDSVINHTTAFGLLAVTPV